MNYKVRRTQINMSGWHTRPLEYDYGMNIKKCIEEEIVYDSVEEVKATIIKMRKEGENRNLVIVGDYIGTTTPLYVYPDRWRL